MDKLTSEQRSNCMSHIRGKNTKQEIQVRQGLHARWFRFRLQDKRLPGKSDILLPKYGVVITVWECELRGEDKASARIRKESLVEE